MKKLLAVGFGVIVVVILTAINSHAQMVVDLNSAGPSQLETLYRVSPKLAAKIIMEREKNGPFSSLENVAFRIKEIGPKTIAKWEGMAIVNQSGID